MTWICKVLHFALSVSHCVVFFWQLLFQSNSVSQYILNLYPFVLNASWTYFAFSYSGVLLHLSFVVLAYWGEQYSRFDEKCILAVLSLNLCRVVGMFVCALKSNQKITFFSWFSALFLLFSLSCSCLVGRGERINCKGFYYKIYTQINNTEFPL